MRWMNQMKTVFFFFNIWPRTMRPNRKAKPIHINSSAVFLSLSLYFWNTHTLVQNVKRNIVNNGEYNWLPGLIILTLLFGGRFVAYNNIPTHHIKPTQDQTHIYLLFGRIICRLTIGIKPATKCCDILFCYNIISKNVPSINLLHIHRPTHTHTHNFQIEIFRIEYTTN